MAKKSVIVLLCLTMILLMCSCGGKKTETVSGTITNIAPYGSRSITAIGDSIAAGYGLDNQNDNYINIFAGNIGATLINDAVSGYDSNDLLEAVKSGKLTRDISTANIIILSIGGNDILHQKDLIINAVKEAKLNSRKYFTPEIEQIYTDFEKNLNSIITLIKTINPTASIIIQTVYNPVLKQGYKISIIDVSKIVDRYIVRLNESILSVCNSSGGNVCVFNVADEMNDDADNFYKADADFDIHPTVHGHQSLADIYTRNFNDIIK